MDQQTSTNFSSSAQHIQEQQILLRNISSRRHHPNMTKYFSQNYTLNLTDCDVVTEQFPDMNYLGSDLGYRQYSGQEERQDQEEGGQGGQGGHHYTNNYYGQTGTMRSWEF